MCICFVNVVIVVFAGGVGLCEYRLLESEAGVNNFFFCVEVDG